MTLSLVWPPPEGVQILRGFIGSMPQPGGSKRAGVVTQKGKGGKQKIVWVPNPRYEGGAMPKVYVTDMSGAKGKHWRDVVWGTIRALLPPDHEPLDAPLALGVVFWMPRTNKGEYGTGRNAGILKDRARAYPTTRPDSTKLLRAFEDALNDRLWCDDTRVVRTFVAEDYAEEAKDVGAEFVLYRLPVTVGERRRIQQEVLTPSNPLTQLVGSAEQ